MFKACLVHFETRWAQYVMHEFARLGMRSRRVRLWRQSSAVATRTSMIEEVVWDPTDPASVQSAIQGGNFIFFDGPHALATTPLADVVRHLRALCDGLRQGGGDRVILMSSCLMAPRVRGECLADERARATPCGASELADKLAILHMEVDRYAVDAMHTNALMPGLVWGPQQPVVLGAAHSVNIMTQRECARMMHAVCTEGRAGARYLIGGTNTTRPQWLALQDAPSGLDVSAANRLAAGRDHALDTSLARRHLGLEPVASVGDLTS